MKWTTVVVVALAMLGLAGNAEADQSITVEFEGPWTFVRVTDNTKTNCGGALTNCIVAISPSRAHQGAVLNGGNNTKTPLDPGVYILGLQNLQPDGIGNGNKPASFVPIPSTSSDRLKAIIAIPSNLPRYVVILPDAPFEKSFEEPPKMGRMEYSEEVRITNAFVSPLDPPQGTPAKYTKGVKIHYTVTDAKATLSGQKNDATNFSANPEAAPLTFTVDPPGSAVMVCDLHPRAAFEEMNNLLHPFPDYQPRDYADFPKYGGECRLLDLQQFNGAVPAVDAILPNADSKKSINVPAVTKLIGNLQDLNSKLQAQKAATNNKDTIQTLLLDVQKYLQENSTDPKKGNGLVDRLDKAIQTLGGFKKAKKKTENERKLILGLATLEILVKIESDTSGANCKAPMMGGNVP